MERSFWIPGSPATFATKGENPWKNVIQQTVPPAVGETTHGLILQFKVPTLAPHNHPIDVDNLCEPVFSTFINKLGWIGGKRTHLQWWHATKKLGTPSGVELIITSSPTPVMRGVAGDAIFDAVYEGILPKCATDSEVPTWLAGLSIPIFSHPSDRLAIRFQFQSAKVNIGAISSGKVKALIDCLYPILGGRQGAPDDWRIDVLQVEKGVEEVAEGAVRICVWKV